MTTDLLITKEQITACAWCYRDTVALFKAYPHLAGLGLPISHGICPAHLEEVKRGLPAKVGATINPVRS